MPAVTDRAVWQKVTKERAGIRWDSVVEKVWKDRGGNQEILSIERLDRGGNQEILSIERFAGYKTEVKEMIE